MQSLTHSASVYWVLCARHGIRNIRKQKGDLRPQENDSLILVYLGGLYYESQKQLKTKIGQDFITQDICPVETGGERVPGGPPG